MAMLPIAACAMRAHASCMTLMSQLLYQWKAKGEQESIDCAAQGVKFACFTAARITPIPHSKK